MQAIAGRAKSLGQEQVFGLLPRLRHVQAKFILVACFLLASFCSSEAEMHRPVWTQNIAVTAGFGNYPYDSVQ